MKKTKSMIIRRTIGATRFDYQILVYFMSS